MLTRFFALPCAAAAMALGGCGGSSEEPADVAVQGTVERETVAEASPALAETAAAAREPLRTGPGPAGREVALEQVNVAGDVLTVQVRYYMPDGQDGKFSTERFPVDEVSVIDDGTAQELGVLQDNRGQFLAAPLDTTDKEEIRLQLFASPVVAWFKFPAPAPETRTVSINIPGAAPFDAVEINRY